MVNGVNISTYYIPKSITVWEDDALDYAVDAFNLFSNTFGLYPYSTLNIVEEYAEYLGMEYPAQVYVSEIIDTFDQPLYIKKWYLEKAIVHEIAHQWWYNLVGFDEVDWGFLDEGLTCWSTDYYGEIIRGDWNYFQYPRYYNRVRTYFATDYLPSKINQSAYELITDNLNWIYISYYKSPLIFEKICRTLGQSNFLLGLSTFFEQYKYEIALLSDLQEVCEDIVNSSLDWLFFPWFDNDYLPNYWITTCDFDDVQYELTVIIEDQNEAVNDYTYSQQVPLYVYDSEDSVIYNDVIWINSTTTLIIPLGIAPEKVRLVYGQDVIVQLWDPAITYIDALVWVDVVIIFGYDVNILLIFCVLPLIYVIYKFSIKKKSNSKI
jgi:aminopeptidase N